MSKTDELLKIAELKLSETRIQFGEDQKRLEELIEERGLILASELIETKPGQKEEIKKLNKAVELLKTVIGDSLPLVNGLKRKILSLKTLQEKEEKAADEKKQNLLEGKMNKISVELIGVLKKADKLNSELGNLFTSWKGLSEKTGKMLFNKKILQPSEKMLPLCYGVMQSEWNGEGGKGRTFYNRIPI